MATLYRLTDEGRDLVDSYDEFADGSEVLSLSEELEDHVESFDVDDATVQRDELTDAINRAKTAFDTSVDTQRSAMDSMLAPLVHQYVDIPPRTAARIGVWQYFTLVEYPEYVIERWEGYGGLKEKLLGDQRDLYSNQMARLWWGGHLTYNETTDHYFATHQLFAKQRLANYVLDSEFRRCRPATLAFVDELYDASGTITDVGRRFNQSLSTYQIEARDRDDFAEQLSTIHDYVR
jgi:hypothetical protein